MPVDQPDFIDPWSYFDYKPSFRTPPVVGTHPNWIGAENLRRLNAYKLLDSYYKNGARVWLTDADEDEQKSRREYGDAALIIDACKTSVVGHDQTLFVEGMEEEPDGGPATDQITVLNDWMEKDRFQIKMMQGELNSGKFGDCVYTLGWNAKKKRPVLRVWDPGFYFPVLDDWSDDEWPTKVHIAWEYERPNNIGQKLRYVRRMTWMLVETADARSYPWNTEPVNETVLFEELEWLLSDVKGEVQDFDRSRAIVIQEEQDLEIDFIPVIHVPNTVAEDDHFGTSTIAKVMQVFDDIVSTDTDLQAASAVTGTPIIGIGGSTAPRDENGNVVRYGPGDVFETGDGKLDMLDTSNSLDALLKYRNALRDTLSINSRTPKTLLGAVEPEKVPSGIVLTLSFHPHSSMVSEMRQVRKNKYMLIFKFVSRFLIANGELGAYLPTELRFGSYLPADRQEIASIVNQLMTIHAISKEVAVKMLMEAGIPIEDAAAEVKRITEQNIADAEALIAATGDIQAGREMLGMPPATDATAGFGVDLAQLSAGAGGAPANPNNTGAPADNNLPFFGA